MIPLFQSNLVEIIYMMVIRVKIFGLKDAPFSPSLDHLNLNINNSKYFRLKNRIVRLDNRKIYQDNEEFIFNRWYYLKRNGN